VAVGELPAEEQAAAAERVTGPEGDGEGVVFLRSVIVLWVSDDLVAKNRGLLVSRSRRDRGRLTVGLTRLGTDPEDVMA